LCFIVSTAGFDLRGISQFWPSIQPIGKISVSRLFHPRDGAIDVLQILKQMAIPIIFFPVVRVPFGISIQKSIRIVTRQPFSNRVAKFCNRVLCFDNRCSSPRAKIDGSLRESQGRCWIREKGDRERKGGRERRRCLRAKRGFKFGTKTGKFGFDANNGSSMSMIAGITCNMGF
jgi:hypothetical protein